jgi:hypothetical protein
MIGRLLLAIVPSFIVGLTLGSSRISAAIWGIVAEGMGVALATLPTLGLAPENHALHPFPTLVSLAIGAAAGLVGYDCRKLIEGRH